MVKVSVVVPVYNPGRYLQPCVDSLLRQSMPAGECELVFVDDGSTDDAPRLLDELAQRHPHVRVHHQENSGWPGKPRNVGVDLARGEYVQFVDQDDELAPEALERLHAIAVRNGSDIVLGKVGGSMAGPSSVFARTVERCTVADAPLIESVSPHKMFRRAFLLDHDIRFPEGKRRLEDQLFMVRAYVRAKTVSILGDYVCYYWQRRDDGGNNSGKASSMRGYYDNLREVLDAVEEGTEPGELRNTLLRRFLRVEMMTRLREPRLLRYSDGYRNEGYKVVRELALERFWSGEVIAGLSPLMRLRATLLERDRLDGLMEIARRCEKVRGFAEVESLRWEDGVLRLGVRAGLVHPDGSPVVVTKREGRYWLDDRLVVGLPTLSSGWDVGDPCDHTQAEVRVHHLDTNTWWFAPGELKGSLVALDPAPAPRYQVVVSGTASLDPNDLAGGSPVAAGRYEVWLSVQTLGLGRPVRVTLDGSPAWDDVVVPAVVGNPARIVVPHRTMPIGQLMLEVDERHQALAGALAARGVGPLHAGGPRLQLTIPVQAEPGAAARDVEVVVGRAGSTRTMSARIEPARSAVLAFDDATSLPSGRHPLALRTDPSGRQPAIPIGTAVVRDGRIVAIQSISYRAIPRRVLARITSDPWLHKQAFKVIEALPDAKARRARKLARRLARWTRG